VNAHAIFLGCGLVNLLAGFCCLVVTLAGRNRMFLSNIRRTLR
jgi:hypothetical protein